MSSVGTSGYVLTSNGTSWLSQAASSMFVSQSYTNVSFNVGYLTETDIVNFTLPGNQLGTNGTLVIEVPFWALYDTSGSQPFFKLYYGTASIAPFGQYITSAAHNGYLKFLIRANNSTASQTLFYEGLGFTNTATGGASVSWFDSSTGTSAIDSTANQTVRITARWSGAGTESGNTLGYYAYVLK